MPEHPLRVVHLAPMLQSGAGRMIVDIARDARAEGIESRVISTGTLNPAMQDWPEYRDRLSGDGIPYTEIDFFSRDEGIFRKSVEKLCVELRERPADLIHAHSGVPAAAAHAALACLGKHTPVVASFYSWGIGRPRWMDEADLAAFGRCAATIVISRWYERFLVDRGFARDAVRLIPCGVDERLFGVRPDRPALERLIPAYRPGDAIAVILAVIEPRKNQMAALRAMDALKEERLHLVLIGTRKDAAYADEVQVFLRAHGLAERVTIAGFVERPFELTAAADLFLFPSLSEGLGIAILEAMALGVPVIGNPVEGAADVIIDAETALAIDPEDVPACAEAIRRLLRDRKFAEQLRLSAQDLVRKRFLWRETMRRTAALYRELQSAARERTEA